ncbi:MAG: JmjC domain-containing protein [Chromatiales bacterium]
MPQPASLLGGLTTSEFLGRHWQKQPLLIRQALPGFRSFITAQELAGLACGGNVGSRLLIEKDGERPWQIKHGPLSTEDFRRLPPTHWTLLVTDVDKILPSAAQLLDRFSFIPRWRIDDLMISYAPVHGGAGPHVDNYDVFLLQAQGRRRWQTGRRRRYADDDFIHGVELRLLADFQPAREWVLEPGDMLYLPPGVAHRGVALDDCLTCSIGFRAPADSEVISAFGDYIASRLDPGQRYSDPDLRPAQHPGKIDRSALRKVRGTIAALARDPAKIDDWFGRFITEPGAYGGATPRRRPLAPRQFQEQLLKQGRLARDSRCRFAHVRSGDRCILYIDGQAYPLDRRLAFAGPLLSGQRRFSLQELHVPLRKAAFLALLCDLYNEGYLSFGP